MDTPEDAGKFRNQWVYVKASDVPPLPEGKIINMNLLDLDVVDENGNPLGKLVEILETGANDVYVVRDESGKEILLPAIPSVILDLDMDRRLLRVHLLEGLIKYLDAAVTGGVIHILMDDKKYWVGFNLIKGIGAVRMQGLVAYFGDLESAWGADPVSLAEAGLGAKVIERVLAARQNVDLDKVWAKIESQGIKILTWQDEAYPATIKRN